MKAAALISAFFGAAVFIAVIRSRHRIKKGALRTLAIGIGIFVSMLVGAQVMILLHDDSSEGRIMVGGYYFWFSVAYFVVAGIFFRKGK